MANFLRKPLICLITLTIPYMNVSKAMNDELQNERSIIRAKMAACEHPYHKAPTEFIANVFRTLGTNEKDAPINYCNSCILDQERINFIEKEIKKNKAPQK